MNPKASDRIACLVMCSVAVGAASCGKTSSPSPVPPYVLIDDMEGTDGRIKWLPSTGWPSDRVPGRWSSATDCAQAKNIVPEPPPADSPGTSSWDYDSLPSYPTMPGVTSTRAAHLRTRLGQPLSGVWGANIGFDFAELLGLDAGSPGQAGDQDAGTSPDGAGCRQGSSRDFSGAEVDLRGYSGVSFWAKAASTGRQVIRVQFNDAQTDPRGNICASPGGSETDCYNGFGKNIMLTDEPTQYWIDFSELRQGIWQEHQATLSPAWDRVYSMNFEVPLPGCNTDTKASCAGPKAEVSFDLWIDDLYFYVNP
jgi:hypothetical protein